LSAELRQAGLEHHGGIHAALRADRRLDLAVRSESAGDLGGDLCELFLRCDNEALIAVGDAVGHSIPAALIMSMARGVIHGLLPDLGNRLSLSELLSRINTALHRVTRAEQFMTLICATLDLRALTLQYANAGHPSPFLVRNHQPQALESHGLLLGILPEAPYGSSTLQLQAEDLLLFYSDGVTECTSSAREAFRTGGLLQAVRTAGHGAEAVAAAVWQAMHEHSNAGTHSPDDRTLLVVRLTGADR
jgi:sigma-B regulation protein RsbU (phosphoserine phosphatase)